MLKRLYYIILQRLYVIKNKDKPCQGKVYMFHKVNDDNDTYSIKTSNFMNCINWLLANKKIVDIDTLVKEKDKNNVVITFDDAFENVYKNAYPFLKEKNVPFYIFINNEFVNQKDFLDEKMINEMLTDSNCILGSHGIKHRLYRFEKEANSFIKESKEELEKMFNREIDTFAFPYGSMYACSDDNIEYAKNIYKNVCMTYPLAYNDELGIIPRINMNDKVCAEEMK